MNSTEFLSPLLHLAQEPLGFFLRPSHTDHAITAQLLSEGYTQLSGVVFDPTCTECQEKLRDEVIGRNLWAVLDTKAMELATPGGFTGKRTNLPWAGQVMHTPELLGGPAGNVLLDALVGYVGKFGYSSVLAPTHFLEHGAADPWFTIDRQLTNLLRGKLDAAGLGKVEIYYPLATHPRLFFKSDTRAALKAGIAGLPISSIWLRIEGFGSSSSALAVQKYISACQDFHSLDHVAIVAEKAGMAAECLAAFGAVSGIECGISSGEAFHFANLRKAPVPGKKGFAAHRLVYLSKIGAFLSPKDAAIFFTNRTMKAAFGCTDAKCCPRGVEHMIANPRRHFAISRMLEIDRLSRVPANFRAQTYLDEFLRPATDQAGRAFRADVAESLRIKIGKTQKRLDSWRATFGEMAQRAAPKSFAPTLERRVQKVVVGA